MKIAPRISIMITVVLVTASSITLAFSWQKSSLDLMEEGSAFYLRREYKRAIVPYRKALDLEKKERRLERDLWRVLVDNLGMSYGISGDLKNAKATFEYGLSKEPTYPMFHYNMACTYGEMDDEENAIKYLKSAFQHKANMIEGERMPNPERDSSFARFLGSQRFQQTLREIREM